MGGGVVGGRAPANLVDGRPATSLPYVPALDGIRGLAVIAVLAFHAGVPGSGGGFLGVSTFFTLSGFLITSLLLRGARTGRPGSRAFLVDFWSRRFRRLMPAALVGIALATVVVAVAGTTAQRKAYPGDVAGALGDVANWRFVLAGRSYQALFTEPSPLQHHWSLAIEEQFYLLLPLVAVVAFRLRTFRGRVLALGGAVAVLALASGASLLAHADTIDRTYYGTDTRALELLVGCLLAVALAHRPSVTAIGRRPVTRRLLAGLGVAALATSVGFWVVADQTSDWLYPLGLPAYASVSVALVLGALVPGPLASVLSLRPLVALGGISYGVYVLHWPLFLLLDEQRTQLDGVGLVAVRVAVTLVLAVALARIVERPIRHRRPVSWLPVRRVRWALGLVVVLLGCSLAVARIPGAESIDFAAAEARFQRDLGGGPTTSAPPAAEAPPPWLVFAGDQSAVASAYSTFPHLSATNAAHLGGRAADPTCSLLRHRPFRDADGLRTNSAMCDDRDTTWTRVRETGQADVVVVQLGEHDLLEHELVAGSDRWAAIGDPELDAALAAELDAVIETMAGEEALVALVTLPTARPVLGTMAGGIRAGTERSLRAARFNQLLAEAVARHPRQAVLVDLDRWMRDHDAGSPRPDGGGPPDPAEHDAMASWLVDRLVAFHADWWRARAAHDDGGAGRTRVLVVGDSTALPLALGLHGHAEARGDLEVASIARSGCGIVRAGARRDRVAEDPGDCPGWPTAFADAIDRFRPDVVLVVSSIWEICDRQLVGDPTWRSIGDPAYDAHLRAELGGALDALHAGGADVGLVLYPHVDRMRGTPEHDEHVVNDPRRMDRYHDVLRGVAAERAFVGVVDLAAHARGLPGGELDPGARPDGVHYTEAAAREIVDAWLADEVRALARR